MTPTSRSDRPARVAHRGLAVMLVTGVVLSFVLAEVVVRAQLWTRPVSFHLVNVAYGQYDAQFGQRFVPNSRKALSLVSNGRVVWCAGLVANANEDGLGGRTTLRDARGADFVIVTTGDSFSYWVRSALTVPDVVESVLHERTGLKVANLNLARGAYGILQMLTVAAETYPTLKPDLVVVQFISDDLTRGRWWNREAASDRRLVPTAARRAGARCGREGGGSLPPGLSSFERDHLRALLADEVVFDRHGVERTVWPPFPFANGAQPHATRDGERVPGRSGLP